MNKLKVQQTGGFPLTTNTLDFMQASYLLMQEFGNIAGDLTIINGCEVRGTRVSPGTVFISGEIFPFKGGTLGDKVVVKETKLQKQFEDGSGKDVEIIREAVFGNGLKYFLWEDFTRITPIKMLQKALTPVGLIAMWGGSERDVPQGWVICNGQNGTPDLSNKFIRGFDYNAYRDDQNNNNFHETGGSDEVKLSEVNLPPHKHWVSLSGSHSHNYRDSYYIESHRGGRSLSGVENLGGNYYGSGKSDSDNSYLYYKNRSTNSETVRMTGFSDKAGGLNGEVKAFDNRPAFYTLAYIMYKG